MTGNEFIRRLRPLGRRKGAAVQIEKKRGKGSHVTVYFGSRKAVLKDPKKEMGRGLFRSVCRHLDVDPDEL